jgi:N-formylglutamate amidohydrolase
MPQVKPGKSRKGKNKAPTTTTQRGQSSSTGLSAEAEQASNDKIANSVIDKLIKGGPTTEHVGEEKVSVDLVHDIDNEEEMDVEFITDGSYNNWEKPTITGAISTPISALIDDN